MRYRSITSSKSVFGNEDDRRDEEEMDYQDHEESLMDRIKYAAFPEGVPTKKTFFKSLVRNAFPSLIDQEAPPKHHRSASIENIDNSITNNVTNNIFLNDYSFDNNYAKNDPDLDNMQIDIDMHYKGKNIRDLSNTVPLDNNK